MKDAMRRNSSSSSIHKRLLVDDVVDWELVSPGISPRDNVTKSDSLKPTSSPQHQHQMQKLNRPRTWNGLKVLFLCVFVLHVYSQITLEGVVRPFRSDKFTGSAVLDDDVVVMGQRDSPVDDGIVPYHITHLFNSFRVKENSVLRKEHLLVQLSWEMAAEYAWKHHRIKVEFLDAILEQDNETVPSFARGHVLEDAVIDPYNKHKLPTIGELFKVGRYEGRGELLIYTNADIGVMEDFYVNIWKLSKNDPYAEEFQRKLFTQCTELMNFCLDFKAEEKILGNPELCAHDIAEYYKLHGGAMDVFPEFKRDLVRQYVQNKTSIYRRQRKGHPVPPQTILESWYVTAGGEPQHMGQDLLSVEMFRPSLPHRPQVARELPSNAFTVTRMDLSVEIKKIPSGLDGLKQLYTAARKADSAQFHPGNDCFVVPRMLVPEMLMNSRHPLSWRPWGMWIPPTFEWENPDMVWRRFESTLEKPLSFHIGVSGRVAENWINLFNKRPLFILSLVAEWNAVTKNKFLEMYDVPSYCNDERLFRQFHFCQRAPSNMRFCQGNVRFACSKYIHPHLRDAYNYMLACARMTRRVIEKKKDQYLVEPYCSFCSGLQKVYGESLDKVQATKTMCNYDYRLVDCLRGHCDYVRK